MGPHLKAIVAGLVVEAGLRHALQAVPTFQGEYCAAGSTVGGLPPLYSRDHCCKHQLYWGSLHTAGEMARRVLSCLRGIPVSPPSSTSVR